MKASASCVVTGAASGIGQAICVMLCQEGGTVVGLDVRDGASTAARCQGSYQHVVCDVSDPAAVDAAFDAIDASFGRAPDVLVNCAAAFSLRHFLDVDVETFDRLYAVNVRGYMLCGQRAARRMRTAGGGRIVNIGSTAAVQAWRNESLYCATKGAVVMLTRGMAVDLAPYNIQVNCVGPGSIDTPGVAPVMHSDEIRLHDLARTPFGRWGVAEEIAAAVRYLAFDARFTTGQVLYVDGGFLATGLGFFGSAVPSDATAPRQDAGTSA